MARRTSPRLAAWVAEHWPAVVGPQIAAVTVPGPVVPDGTLDVRVASEAWAAELGAVEARVLAKLNARPGERLTGIRWTVIPAGPRRVR